MRNSIPIDNWGTKPESIMPPTYNLLAWANDELRLPTEDRLPLKNPEDLEKSYRKQGQLIKKEQ